MKLILQVLNKREKKVVEVSNRSHFTIGRRDCTLLLDDAFCSGQHALLYEGHDGELHLRDLESRNGTYCEKQKIDEVILFQDAEFRIGGTVIKVILFESASKPKKEKKLTAENSPAPNSQVLMGWPNMMRSVDKDRLKDLVDYIDEKGRKNSLRLLDILEDRKKAG